MYRAEQADVESERTAFRKAEKKYKLYYLHGSSKKKKVSKPVDLSEVIDFEAVRESYEQKGELPGGVAAVECEFGRTTFRLDDRPGFYFIPGALSLQEQTRWTRESLIRFPQPPNRTNHNVEYGPINDLFVAVMERRVLVETKSPSQSGVPTSESCAANGSGCRWKFVDVPEVKSIGKGQKTVTASVLLRKLRWSTLGLQFNWSQRNYDVSLPHNKIPDDLCQLAMRMASPAMGPGEQFKPEAAIVNYFGLGDTLGGHVDDMEADWSKPIVSLSLGSKAIFLLGGKTRDEAPIAMFLRSGDVVLMAGEARECFHGVPRIFTNEEDDSHRARLEQEFSDPEDWCFWEYIKASRVNINIRQVF